MKQTVLESLLINIRRHLHQYPELSNQEFETTNSIQKWLSAAGIELRSTGLRTGVFAEIIGEKPGLAVVPKRC